MKFEAIINHEKNKIDFFEEIKEISKDNLRGLIDCRLEVEIELHHNITCNENELDCEKTVDSYINIECFKSISKFRMLELSINSKKDIIFKYSNNVPLSIIKKTIQELQELLTE